MPEHRPIRRGGGRARGRVDVALGRPGRSLAPPPRGPRCPVRAALTCPARGPAGRTPGSSEPGREMVSARGPGRDREGLVPTGRSRPPAAAGPGVPAPGGPDPSLRPRLRARGLSVLGRLLPEDSLGVQWGGGAGEECGETCRGPWARGTPWQALGPRSPRLRFSVLEPGSGWTLVLRERRTGSCRWALHPEGWCLLHAPRGGPGAGALCSGDTSGRWARGPRAVRRPRETLETHARGRPLEKLYSLSGAAVWEQRSNPFN